MEMVDIIYLAFGALYFFSAGFTSTLDNIEPKFQIPIIALWVATGILLVEAGVH